MPLSSASVWMSPSRLSRESSMTRPSVRARARTTLRLPDSRWTSPYELGRAVDDDQFFACAAGPHDVDFTVEDGEEAVGVVVGLEQDLPGRHLARLPVCEQPLQLGRGQPRKQSLAALDGWRWVGAQVGHVSCRD
jgi:hypothetical protein